MGIIPLFDWGEANALFFGKFSLINRVRKWIKAFEPFENNSLNYSMINAILIFYSCVFKRSIKPVLKKALGFNLSKKRETNIKNY